MDVKQAGGADNQHFGACADLRVIGAGIAGAVNLNQIVIVVARFPMTEDTFKLLLYTSIISIIIKIMIVNYSSLIIFEFNLQEQQNYIKF